MGKYNGAVITTAGQNIIAESISGTLLEWTVMRSSSVAIPAGTNLEALTSLTGIEQSTHITDASVYGNNVLQVSARFSNTGVSTAYLIQTVGIYGQLTGGSETLIAVMTAVTPDEMPVYDPDSPSAFIFNTQVTVTNADSVTMVVNDTGTATVADLNRKVDITGGDVSDTVVNTVVAESAEYPVPAAGDTVKVIIGKIAKFFADIVRPFTGATSSAVGKKGLVPAPSAGQQTAYMRGDGTWVQPQNNATTTAAGYNLDARMGKTLQDQITSLNDSFAAKGRLIARDDVTTDIVTKTLPNGETFSRYSALVFVAQVNSSTRGSLWIPAGRFAEGYDCYVIATAGTIIGNIYVRYVSDTSYSVKGDNAAFNYLAIYAG